MSRWLTQLRLILQSVFNRERVDLELEEELQEHLQREIEEGLRSGLDQEEARYAARRAMGAIAKSKEESRDARRVNFIDDLSRDLRYAGRSMRRSPGFTTLAVMIMALGIGANTAVFSVVNAVLLKPLAYRDPERIVTLSTRVIAGSANAAQTSLDEQISIPNFQDWHDQSSSFEAMAYYNGREIPATAGATAEYARGTQVGPEFFQVFDVEPVLGRFFTTEEGKPGSGGAAMISYAYWQSHFAGDPHALGQTIRVYGRALPVVGVLPPGYRFPDDTDLWVPRNIGTEDMKDREGQNWLAVGRLKPGVPLESAQAEMTIIARRLEQQYPEANKDRTVGVKRLRDKMVGDVRLTLYLLLGAVTIVLLIACANTATLLLGKATARTREIAVRAALGASRRRIIRQLITESLLLAIVAGAAGLLLAYWGSAALVAVAPPGMPRLTEVAVDRWVLAFTIGVSILTSLLFGLVPAMYASQIDLNEALKQSAAKSVVGGGIIRMRGLLVVGEIAMAVVLLSGSALLIKSFIALHRVALGFRPENVLVMRATIPAASTQDISRFFQDLLPKIARTPGVLSAGATMAPPGHIESSGGYFVDHLPSQPDWTSAPNAVLSVVAPGTLAALAIPLKMGRDFSEGDTAEKPLVALVNEALMRRSFPDQDPIGRTIFCPYDKLQGMTIIGVVGDVRQSGPADEPKPECYMTYRQHLFNGNTLSVVARTVGDPIALEETLRRLAQETSPDVPMKFTTMDATLSENVAAPRFRTLLFGIFAGLAVCLAMAGVYGVMAFAVSQRSNEIGLRMALGASTGSVLRLILRQALICGSLGLALGLAAAAAGTRMLTSMLFQVQPNDPWVYLAVAALLGVVTLVASYVPARRAAKIDPLTALRQE